MDEIREFIRFLKNKNAFHKYMNNFFKDRNFRNVAPFFNFAKKNLATEYIGMAFEWRKTDEGYDFWCNLYYEWQFILKRR